MKYLIRIFKLKNMLSGLLIMFFLFSGTLKTKAQPISPYLIGQNAWMPSSAMNTLWPEMKTAGYEVIRIGGNSALQDNRDLSKLITLIDNIHSIGAEPIVQVPNDFTSQQTTDYITYINHTMNRGVKNGALVMNQISLNFSALVRLQIIRVVSALPLNWSTRISFYCRPTLHGIIKNIGMY